jgi:hypothetical protein
VLHYLPRASRARAHANPASITRSSNEGNLNGNCEESEEVHGPQVDAEDHRSQVDGSQDDGSQVDAEDGSQDDPSDNFEEALSDASSSKRPEPFGFGAFFFF